MRAKEVMMLEGDQGKVSGAGYYRGLRENTRELSPAEASARSVRSLMEGAPSVQAEASTAETAPPEFVLGLIRNLFGTGMPLVVDAEAMRKLVNVVRAAEPLLEELCDRRAVALPLTAAHRLSGLRVLERTEKALGSVVNVEHELYDAHGSWVKVGCAAGLDLVTGVEYDVEFRRVR